MESIINSKLCTEDPEWNESYYFVFYDKKENIGGMSRIGFKPNKREGMTFFFLFLPDGSAAGYHQEIEIDKYINPLNVLGTSHNYKSEGIWKYKFNGNMIFVKNPEDLPKVRKQQKLIASAQHVELNLDFKSINETYEYSEFMTPESLEIGKKAGDKHWEQIAKISGEIKIGKEKFEIYNSFGQRDHTYGVRDWTGVGNWLYYVVWFGEKLAINPAAIITNDGRISTGGFLFKEGRNIPLKSIHVVDQKFRKNHVFPISSELELIDCLDVKHRLKAKVGPIIPIPFIDKEGKESILIQSLGKFELNEIKGGYGLFETLRKSKYPY
jgi:hypothetical protein